METSIQKSEVRNHKSVKKTKRTSVSLSPLAQQIKEIYSFLPLKSVLSAGLVLFAEQNEEGKAAAMMTACVEIQNCRGTKESTRIKKIVAEIASCEGAAASLVDLNEIDELFWSEP